MARVQGDCHRCGRTVRAEVAPNRRTADWRAANRVFTCDSCRDVLRQQRTDAAHAWAVACDLPELEGTDAQIEWAEVIRQEKLPVLLELAWALDPDADEVLRLKQMTGLAGLFRGQGYSRAWVRPDGAPIEDEVRSDTEVE